MPPHLFVQFLISLLMTRAFHLTIMMVPMSPLILIQPQWTLILLLNQTTSNVSITSAGGPQNNLGAETEPPSSTVVSSAPASCPRKATKSVAGSAAGSSHGQVLKSPSVGKSFLSASQAGATMASQKVLKMSQAATFTELKHLMAGLLDTLCITLKDSAAKS